MKKSDYEAYVKSRCKDYVDEPYLVVALNEEAGEVAGWYKKFVLRGNPTGKFTEDDLKGELGDILFYLVRLGQLHNWDLSDIMEANKTKLDDRLTQGMRQIV